jgi:hypothetical protein
MKTKTAPVALMNFGPFRSEVEDGGRTAEIPQNHPFVNIAYFRRSICHSVKDRALSSVETGA